MTESFFIEPREPRVVKGDCSLSKFDSSSPPPLKSFYLWKNCADSIRAEASSHTINCNLQAVISGA